MFSTLVFTSSVYERLSLCKPRKHSSGTKKGNFEEVTADDEGFLEGGSPNHRGSSAYGSPCLVKGDEVRFVDGGRRNAANPWNLDKLKTPLFALGDSLTRPFDDPMADADLSMKSLIEQMEEQAEKTREMLKILSEATGMPIVQENGQRRYGPPLDCTTPPPRGSEVFVGKIPRDALEPELVPAFSKAGRIYELRLMMDFSGTNRGYCFVQYFTPEEADRAVMMLNHFEIRRGRPIGVSKSVDNCRLFVGGIPFDKQENDILNEIRLITDGVVRVIVYQNPRNASENRGYAFVEYESHKAAAMARRKMIPGNIQLFGCDVAVDWAEPESDQKRAIRRNRQNTITSPKTRQPKTNNKQPLAALPGPSSIVNHPPNVNYNFCTYDRYQQPACAPFAANYNANYNRYQQPTACAPFAANYNANYNRYQQQPACTPFAGNYNANYNRYQQQPARAPFAANYNVQPSFRPFNPALANNYSRLNHSAVGNNSFLRTNNSTGQAFDFSGMNLSLAENYTYPL